MLPAYVLTLGVTRCTLGDLDMLGVFFFGVGGGVQGGGCVSFLLVFFFFILTMNQK